MWKNNLTEQAFLTLFILLFCLIFLQTIFLWKWKKEKEQWEVKMKEQEHFFRHDYINHLQIIYSLLQLHKIEKACAYIKEIKEKIPRK